MSRVLRTTSTSTSTPRQAFTIAPTTASTIRTSFGSATKVVPNKIPTIQLASFGTLDGGPYPSRSGGIVYDVGDTITKVWGNHTLKFGGLWEYAGENNYDQISVDNTRPGTTNNQNGLFTFTDTRGGGATSKAAVANTALGLFDTYGEIGTRSYTLFRGNMFEGFAQDQWRMTPKLVLEYGVRYSVMMPYHALWGNQAFFSEKDYDPALAPTVNPVTGFITGGDPLNGVVIPGTGFPSSAQGHVPDSILNGGYERLFRGYPSGYSPTVYTRHPASPRLCIAAQSPVTVCVPGAAVTCSALASATPFTSAVMLRSSQRRTFRGQCRQSRRHWRQRHSARLHLSRIRLSKPRGMGMEHDV